MKSILLILSGCMLFFVNSCSQSQDFKKLSKSEVNPKEIQLAKKFAHDYLTKLKNGSYYQFHNEAIDVLRNQLTEAKQKASYQQLKNKFGDFESLDYAETWVPKGNPGIKVLRFKAVFDKSNKKLEVRVVLNVSDKIAGFWIRPWSDMLN